MKHVLGLLVLLSTSSTLGAAPVSASAAQSAPSATDARLESAVDRYAAKVLADKTAAGLTVGIMEKGRLVFIKGYGFADLENRTPMNADTVFRIGSVTKEFAAASIMLLAERGKLSIDDPITKYFPQFPRSGGVTVRHLLNHTSGLKNYTGGATFYRQTSRQDLTSDEMVANIAKLDPLYDFEPGTAWNYSNSGYILLGAIIEKVSGQPYAQFIRANLLDPLGLRDTGMDDLAQIVPNRAQGYEKSKEAPTGFENTDFMSMSGAGSAGAMRSTAADLLKWHEALFGGKVLEPETVALMSKLTILKDGRVSSLGWTMKNIPFPPFDYGLGLIIDKPKGHRTIGHGGSINGFNAWAYILPDDQFSIVLLTNTSGAASGTAPQLVEAIFDGRSR